MTRNGKLQLPLFIFFFLIIFIYFFSSFGLAVSEKECDQKKGELSQYIDCLAELQTQTGAKAQTLAGEISLFDTQISLTLAQISQSQQKIESLEEEIAGLSGKIGRLNTSLDRVSTVLINRIASTYKAGTVNSLDLFLSSDSFSDFLSRHKYLKIVQIHDKKLLLAMEETKTNYEAQKSLKEEKQAELEQLSKVLEAQKIKLAEQKKDREYLLTVTKQDEKRYQQLLAVARAEYEALQAIMAGKGAETESGPIKAGEKIASVISGSSCNSSGTHLHFMVTENGATKSPFNYLKSVDYENCSGGFCGSPDGDPFNPGGNWDWPVSPKIILTQGYGNTWAVNHTWVRKIYSFHNGIDIKGSSRDVKAVSDGILYRGSYGGSGCRLLYVRVDHNDSNLETYYLHVM